MAASPVAGPTPAPSVLTKFDAVCLRMPQIAVAIDSFADPTLRERAYYELIGILNPSPDDLGEADITAARSWGDAPASAAEIGKLATWILNDAPTAWRDSIRPGETTVDAAIRFLEDGDQARAALLLVRRELVEQGGFTVEQAEGDLIPLIRQLAADPPVTSPEIEQLAAHLRAEAEPGETAVQVALRVIERLRQGRPHLVAAPDVQQVANGVHADADQVDDRGERERQPDRISDAIAAYKERTGTS